MKTKICLIMVLILIFSVSSIWASPASISAGNIQNKGLAIEIDSDKRPIPVERQNLNRAYDWYEYAGSGDITTYFSGYSETATFFQLIDFSLIYPATIEQVEAWFYNDGTWDSSTFHFKIYDSDGSTLLYESGDLTAVHFAAYAHTLTTPLVVTDDFYVAVATDPGSGNGSPYVLGCNYLNGHSYGGSAGAWTLYPNYELIRAVYLEGTIPTVPIFSVDPNPYHFSDIEPLDVFTQVFTFSNLGAGTITIDDVADITLTGDAEFSIVNIVGVPGTLPPDNISVEVQYAPLALGSHSTILSIDWGTAKDITNVDITGNACNHPANDDCINAEPITGPYPASGSGSNECTYVDCPGVLDWTTVWYEIDLPYTVNDLEITICAVDTDPTSVGVVVMDDCACDDYIVKDGGLGWITCPSTFDGYNMIFTGIAGPTTVFWPAYLIDADGGIAFDYEIDITLNPPTGIDININYGTDEVEITWTVEAGLTYNVYSHTDPYAVFPGTPPDDWTLEESGNTTGVYTETPIPGVKKFYIVTANY